MPPNSVCSVACIWAVVSLAVRQSTQPANRSSTSRASVLPMWRHTSSNPAKVLCRQ